MTELRGLLLALPVVLWGWSAGAVEVSFSGSAYVDEWLLGDASARASSLGGVTPEATVKLEADVHEFLSFSAKACFSCHGLEVDRAYLEATPRKFFNVQAGRVVVPFGEFSQRYDPANHRTSSKPLMYEMGRMPHFGATKFNLGIVPAPYVDTGVVVFGQVWPTERLQLSYAAYAVAGLRGKNDFDFASMRSLYYVDNNATPAGGARAVLTLTGGEDDTLKDVSLGVSAMYGRYDPAHRLDYFALGADLTIRVGKVTIHAEAALLRRGIDSTPILWRYDVIDAFVDKLGAYVEVEHPIGERLSVVYRIDGLRRAGNVPVSADSARSPDSFMLRATVGGQLKLTDAFFAKLSYEYTLMNDFPSFHGAHAGLGGTF